MEIRLDVRRAFLDLSKAFDRVWHDGLMYKLKTLGICGNYCGLIYSFLSDRHQRVILNRQPSKWSHIKAGVSQGSILGPLLFLVYINDLPESLTTSAKLFADDTTLSSVVHDSAASKAFLNDDSLKHLTQMPQNRLKRLFPLAKQTQVTTKMFILTMYQ